MPNALAVFRLITKSKYPYASGLHTAWLVIHNSVCLRSVFMPGQIYLQSGHWNSVAECSLCVKNRLSRFMRSGNSFGALTANGGYFGSKKLSLLHHLA
jgi:hypothetical protein